MSIKLLLTGGTIDKSYNESNGELDFTKTHIPDLFELGRNRADINIEQLMLKDSLQMDDADRQEILNACIKTVEDKIIITHGTDTMVETAKVLGEAILNNLLDKTIVIVGAMVPFVFKHSDAMFNVGFALASVQTLDHGVYIAMNGNVFEWNKVEKNRERGVFEATK
ncbi:MAG TPA: asparaginase [Leucothrix mucor]|nr:asparaginase [Leucothrix mucor]